MGAIDLKHSSSRVGTLVIVILCLLSATLVPSVNRVLNHQTSMMFGFIDALGGDYLTFYTASRMAIGDEGADVYDRKISHSAQIKTEPRAVFERPWFYPPTTFFLTAPFALLPSYLLSYWVWTLAGVAAFAASMRANGVSVWLTALLVCSFTGIVTLATGQMSWFILALFCFGLAALRTGRQRLAGVMFGLVVIKATLGLVIPVAVIAARQWRTFWASALTVFATLAASCLWPGLSVWRAFIGNLQMTFRHVMGKTDITAINLSNFSPMGFFKCHIANDTVCVLLQLAITTGVAAVVWRAWRRHGATARTGSVLLSGTALASPYFMHYEIVMLIGAALLLTTEKPVRSGAWLAVLAAGIAAYVHILSFNLNTQLVWLISAGTFLYAAWPLVQTSEKAPI
jgi:hypothetical protein